MIRLSPAPLLLVTMLSACSAPGGPFPSLQPRAAEAIDPRLPVDRPINDRPVSEGLTSTLAGLVGQARSGQAAFAPAMARAEQLASGAGAAQSESWIAAEEALSAAVAARAPTSLALEAVDGIGGDKLQAQAGMAPADAAALQAAGAEVYGLDRQQQDRIDAVQRRLGR
jgi:hypothetical protein